MLNRPRQQGFSLLELMIAITLLGILLVLGIPGMGNWLQNAQIRTATDSMLGGLQLARSEAIRRNTLVQFVLVDTNTEPTKANVNSITASTSGKNWMVRVYHSTGSYGTADFVQGRSGAEGTSNVAVSAGQSSIVFNALGRVTPLPTGNITINLTNPRGDRPLRIVVTPGGQVRMCDPNLPSSNVQSC